MITCCPRSADRLTWLPSSSGRVKSGAGSPGASRSSLTQRSLRAAGWAPVTQHSPVAPTVPGPQAQARVLHDAPRPANLPVMTPLSAYSPLNSGRGRRRAAAVALCAAALAVMAGCSTGSGSSSVPLGTTGPTGTTGTTGTATKLAPLRAIRLAGVETQRVSSMAATVSEQVGNPVIVTATTTMRLQLRPTLLADAIVHATISGRSVSMHEIVSAKAVYLQTQPGNPTVRPWTEIPFSALGHGLGGSLSSLLQSARNSNPAQQTQLLTASKNAHVVGTTVVYGVETTHYRGSISAATALASLKPSVRKGLAPLLKLITG